jgi:hypothetical protein
MAAALNYAAAMALKNESYAIAAACNELALYFNIEITKACSDPEGIPTSARHLLATSEILHLAAKHLEDQAWTIDLDSLQRQAARKLREDATRARLSLASFMPDELSAANSDTSEHLPFSHKVSGHRTTEDLPAKLTEQAHRSPTVGW